MYRILLFLFLAMLLSGCAGNNAEIRYSGQVNGVSEARGFFTCNKDKIPAISLFPEDGYMMISLLSGIDTGNFQFSSGNSRGNEILFYGQFPENDGYIFLEFEDLISGDLTLTQLPEVNGGWTEGDFKVIYPNMMVEGNFKFRADPDTGPYDCVN